MGYSEYSATPNAFYSNGNNFVDAVATWSKPDSSKTMTGLQLAFTNNVQGFASGYYVYVNHVVSGSVVGIGTYSTSSGKGDFVINLPASAWSGLSSDTLTLRFKKAPDGEVRYTNVRLIVQWDVNAEPSTVSVQNAIAGEPQTVNLTNTVSTVKHDVTWTYYAEDGTTSVVSSGVQHFGSETRSPAWAVPSASLNGLIQQSPNRGTIIGKITVETFTTDGVSVGSQTVNTVLTIPKNASTIPSLSVAKQAVHDQYGTASGANYLQNHTALKITPTASGQLSATIAAIYIITPDGTFSATNGQPTDIPITKSGTYSITVTVTDTRGISNTNDQEITVTAYSTPSVTSLVVERVDANHDPTDEGEIAHIAVSAVAGTGFSIASYAYSIAQTGGSGSPDTGILVGGEGYISGPYDSELSYTVIVTVTDSIGIAVQVTAYLATALYTIHRMAGGKGIGFGQIADRYGVLLNPDWPLYAHGKEIQELLLDFAHPVGSVIQTLDDNFDPNVEWPWTVWGKLKDVFLLAAGTRDILASGGSESTPFSFSIPSQTVTLTVDNLPQTTIIGAGNIDKIFGPNENQSYEDYKGSSAVNKRNHGSVTGYSYYDLTRDPESITINGGSVSTSIGTMPPYLAVNMWVRAK